MPLPPWVEQVKVALKSELRSLGIKAQVVPKSLGRTMLIRFYVFSDDFESVDFDERQAVVWRIAREALDGSQTHRISMFVTATKDEFGKDEYQSLVSKKRVS